MRAFIAGLMCGALVYAAGSAWIARGSSDPSASLRSVAAHHARSDVHPFVADEASSQPRAIATVSADGSSRSQAGECIEVDDSNLERVAMTLLERSAQLKYADLKAEPKDPLWSAVMEQSLRQGIAAHPLGRRFTLTSVDCRTLYCELKAEYPMSAAEAHGGDAFRNVVDEVAEGLDLWIGESGSGSMEAPGFLEAHAILRRFKPGDTCPPGFQEDCWNR